MLNFLHEVVLHTVVEVLPIIVVLFLAYFIMELVEGRLTELSSISISSNNLVTNFIVALFGVLPTCAIPSLAVNLFISGIVNIGTIVTVFLATSDEMLQILIASGAPLKLILIIITYKIIVATVIGYFVGLLYNKRSSDTQITDLCEEHHCHCEEQGALRSSINHTVITTIFILSCLLVVNGVIYFGANDVIETILKTDSILKYICAGLIGLIPSCAPSIIATTLYCEEVISIGTMLSCVFSTSGVGLILFAKLQHQKRQIIIVALILLVTSIVCGAFFDILSNILFI